MKYFDSETGKTMNYPRVRIQITENDLLNADPVQQATNRTLSYHCPEDEWWVIAYSKRLSKMMNAKKFVVGTYYIGYKTYKKSN